jgi:hypothetical protein
MPVSAEDNDGMKAGESMIVNAVSKIIVNLANGVLSALSGLNFGNGEDPDNNTGEQISLFGVAAHPLDPTTEKAIKEEVEKTKDVYIWGMKFFGLLITFFMIIQQMAPHTTAQAVAIVRGQPGYVTIEEMAQYYIIVGLWFAFGPGSLYAALYLNNYLTQSLNLPVLGHVIFTSFNEGFFGFLVTLWGLMMGFFAFRVVYILLAFKAWYLLGLALAWKRIRWIGALTVPYTFGIVFAQGVIIWTVVSVVVYSESSSMSWAGTGFLYLGMFIFVIIEAFIALFWPKILKWMSPTSYYLMINVARSV